VSARAAGLPGRRRVHRFHPALGREVHVTQKTRVAVRLRDGRVLKGYTLDFNPNREKLHVIDPADERKTLEVTLSEVKAIFYVRTFEGDSKRVKPKDITEKNLDGMPGVKLKVTFKDGEVMFGTATAYSPGRTGFFMTPADKNSNNERVFVVTGFIEAVKTWR
jgi:small nuclear ribonucleoprotein (snRNP)-like protein